MAEGPSLNDRVRGMAQGPRSIQEESDNIEDVSPLERLNQVTLKSSSYAVEYRLKLVHRLLMRNIPLDQIAQQLNVSVRTIERDRKLLVDEMKKVAKKLDIEQLIGESLSFYQEVQGMALRAASVAKAPVQLRMLALRTAGSSRKDMHSFLEKVGVFEALPYIATEQNTVDDISNIANLIESIISDDTEGYQQLLKSKNIHDLAEEDDKLDDDGEEENYEHY